MPCAGRRRGSEKGHPSRLTSSSTSPLAIAGPSTHSPPVRVSNAMKSARRCGSCPAPPQGHRQDQDGEDSRGRHGRGVAGPATVAEAQPRPQGTGGDLHEQVDARAVEQHHGEDHERGTSRRRGRRPVRRRRRRRLRQEDEVGEQQDRTAQMHGAEVTSDRTESTTRRAARPGGRAMSVYTQPPDARRRPFAGRHSTTTGRNAAEVLAPGAGHEPPGHRPPPIRVSTQGWRYGKMGCICPLPVSSCRTVSLG